MTCWSERQPVENSGKLDYRAIAALGATFRFRVKPLETDFMFADGSVKTFTNWDVKGVRERFYKDEYVVVPVEEYLLISATTGETMEHGIKGSDIRKFIESKAEFFEDLLLEAAGNTPLDADDEL